MKPDQIKAFPSDFGINIEVGMTLRDYFAAKAMHALIASYANDHDYDTTELVQDAYYIADTMMEVREDEDN